MKIIDREKNSFSGGYIGYHDEIEIKKTPIYYRVMVVIALLIVAAGIIIALYGAEQGSVSLFVYTIFGTMIVEFPYIHLLLVLFDKIKYGKVRRELKIVGPMLSGVSIFLLIGVTLSFYINFFVILAVGIFLIFYAIGIGLVTAGSKILKRQQKNCTMSIWAVCSGYESLTPHLTILDDSDLNHAQNERIARVEVQRPIWEFDFNGETIHATPEHYEGKLKIVEGKQYKIFVNPDNPQEVFCLENDNATFLLGMGKFWLIFTTALLVIMCGIMILIGSLS